MQQTQLFPKQKQLCSSIINLVSIKASRLEASPQWPLHCQENTKILFSILILEFKSNQKYHFSRIIIRLAVVSLAWIQMRLPPLHSEYISKVSNV